VIIGGTATKNLPYLKNERFFLIDCIVIANIEVDYGLICRNNFTIFNASKIIFLPDIAAIRMFGYGSADARIVGDDDKVIIVFFLEVICSA
jgi:hypothetical protein